MAGLKAAPHKPTNLAKVYDVRQGKDKSPAAFLERVIRNGGPGRLGESEFGTPPRAQDNSQSGGATR